MSFHLNNIKCILFDVDGVLTNGDIIYTEKSVEVKCFHVQDGLGITLAQLAGLKTAILTSRQSKVVDLRADQLKIDIVSQGSLNKLQKYLEIIKELNLSDEEICYIGDDVLDLPVLNRVGFSVAVANAREEVKRQCDYITSAAGGQGAVREVIDLILQKQNKFNAVITRLINEG
jgi:3-deoxy-D-manno-octulosonate 8-phosphate phosphatase (KDO 8-P phosphatase)